MEAQNGMEAQSEGNGGSDSTSLARLRAREKRCGFGAGPHQLVQEYKKTLTKVYKDEEEGSHLGKGVCMQVRITDKEENTTKNLNF